MSSLKILNEKEITCLPGKKNSLVKVVIVLKRGESYTKGEVRGEIGNRKQNKNKPLIISCTFKLWENIQQILLD